MGTLRAGAPWVSPNVAVFALVPQWAAVVTMSGCTRVPVQPAPASSTVVGHSQVPASWPPKMGARVGATGSGAGPSQAASQALVVTAKAKNGAFMSPRG